MRCLFSALSTVRKPLPLLPTIAVSWTIRSFRKTSPMGAPSCSIFGVDPDVLKPSAPRSTRKAVMPSDFLLSGSVRTNTVNKSAVGVMYRLCPLSRKYPFGNAVTLDVSALASEPASTSVSASAQSSSPEASRGRYLRLISSLASCTSASAPTPVFMPTRAR